jgi:hypothetical protein
MRYLITTALVLLTAATLSAGSQFRIAGNSLTPVPVIPGSAAEWQNAVWPTEESLSGWHWEVILNRIGFGMHYAMRFVETGSTPSPYSVNWKGDLFLSYHPLGGGSLLDPFVEFGWGNAGSAQIRSAHDTGYPNWRERTNDESMTELVLYNYAAAGLALDLKGLLVGARLAWMPTQLRNPIPDRSVTMHNLPEFELGLFGGIALGGRRNRTGPSRSCYRSCYR